MSLHKRSSAELTHLKGCKGCHRVCKWRSIVSVDGGNDGKFTCNRAVKD